MEKTEEEKLFEKIKEVGNKCMKQMIGLTREEMIMVIRYLNLLADQLEDKSSIKKV